MEWQRVRLGHVLSLEYGKSLPGRLRDFHGEFPVAGSNGPDGRHVKALVSSPGVVVGRKGSAGMVQWYDEDFWPIDTTYYVVPKVRLEMRWAYYLLRDLRLDRLATTTGVPGLNRNDAYALEIPLPPISEQRRIVEILDQADFLRRLRAEADAKAAQILPALFIKMFGDPSKESESIERRTLRDLIVLRSGNFLRAKDMDAEGIFAVYGGNGVTGYHSEYMFSEPKVVIGRVGFYCGAVHYSAPRSWITDNALYVADMSEDLHPRYLIEALRMANLGRYAERASQPLISANRIYPVEIAFPPQERQRRFADLAACIELHGAQTQKARAVVDKLCTVLLHQGFSTFRRQGATFT